MRGSNIAIIGFMAVGLVVLISLGTWQVKRLYWKEALIERVNAQLKSEPLAVGKVLSETTTNIDYRPIAVSGTYLSDQAFFEFTTHNGQSGWHQFAVLDLNKAEEGISSQYAFVNRGFIPYDAKDDWQSIAPLPKGEQLVTGLMRSIATKKPGSFMPDNQPLKNIYYWRDLNSMATSINLNPDSVAQWYVDEGIPGKQDADNQFPLAGTTIVSFPNNHLQYVLTWYGLALALLGVGSYFIYARRNSNGQNDE